MPHVGVHLQDGRNIFADHRQPIVREMRKINKAIGLGKPLPLDAPEYLAVIDWAGENPGETCLPPFRECSHP
jgi:hypothetical protein